MNEVHYLMLYSRSGTHDWVKRSSEAEVCDYLSSVYEGQQIDKERLKAQSRHQTLPEVIQYDAADLFNFIDVKISEVLVLRFDPQTAKYTPQGRDWLKSRMYEFLQGQVQSKKKETSSGGVDGEEPDD